MMRTGMLTTDSPGGTRPTATSPSLEKEVVLPRSLIVIGEHDSSDVCALVKDIKTDRMKKKPILSCLLALYWGLQ